MAEDNSWVFDSLVCFLHGPIWNAPLQTFVEENSLIFDPNEKQDEHCPEYRRIHEEYKNLVDFMLGSFMDEMQITPEQFEVACLESRQNGPNNVLNFHQGLFQQIWAANDIRIFIRMMTQRNVELQLQALDLIERRQISKNMDNTENTFEEETDQSHHVTNEDNAKDTSTVPDEETTYQLTDEKVEKEIFQAIENEISKETQPILDNIEVGDEALADSVTNDKFQRLNLFFEKERISSADVKYRQEYLRTQRDKLLEIKKKARASQLTETVNKRSNGRPTSAQAAQAILEDGASETVNGKTNEASMQLRKTLAKRLRNEVVGDE